MSADILDLISTLLPALRAQRDQVLVCQREEPEFSASRRIFRHSVDLAETISQLEQLRDETLPAVDTLLGARALRPVPPEIATPLPEGRSAGESFPAGGEVDGQHRVGGAVAVLRERLALLRSEALIHRIFAAQRRWSGGDRATQESAPTVAAVEAEPDVQVLVATITSHTRSEVQRGVIRLIGAPSCSERTSRGAAGGCPPGTPA